jgi:hypothetical protein
MDKWKNIQINRQNIETETERAILFNCPHKSNFDGWVFWHPSKLVRDGKHSHAVSVSYNDEFQFNLKKFGKNKNLLGECKISVAEFEDMFNVMDKNIIEKKEKDPYEKHIPQPIEDKGDATVDPSLMR